MKNELIIYGASEGDSSVGINSGAFRIETGMPIGIELIDTLKTEIYNKESLKRNINKKIDEIYKYKNPTYQEYLEMLIKEIFQELHDNGNIKITFSSDELEEKDVETTEEGLEKI